MNKKKSRFTFLMFSDIAGKCFRLSIAKRTVKVAVITLLVVFAMVSISSTIFVKKYLSASQELQSLSYLKEQTVAQRRELDLFTQKIKSYEVQMAKLERFDKKLRAIIAIEDSEVTYAHINGTGGPEKNNFQRLSEQDEANKALFINRMDKNINQLSLDADERLLSFQQINDYFKDQNLLLTSTPSIWPVNGWVTSGFGYRKSPFTGLRDLHEGLDIATGLKTKVIAPADGIVIRDSIESGYGKILEIDHGFGIITRFGHNSKHLVKIGEKVKRGQPIAYVGTTGLSTGPHLHYEIVVNGVPVNPYKFLLEGL